MKQGNIPGKECNHMPDIVYSTGPIEIGPGVNQLRIKALNNSPLSATAQARVYSLDGTKAIFATHNFTLPAGSSGFATVNIGTINEFEVQFTVSNAQVLVAVFAVKSLQGEFSAANSIRHREMVSLTAGVTDSETIGEPSSNSN